MSDDRAHHRLRELGWEVNRERVQRLWREERLRSPPQRKRERRRLAESTSPRPSGCARSSRITWGRSIFSSDQTADEQALKLVNIVDEFTRRSLVMLVARSIDADTVVATLERLVAERQRQELLRCDDGPEMTRRTRCATGQCSSKFSTFIEQGSPSQNPFVESFHSRVRDELLDVEGFSCLAEARVVISNSSFVQLSPALRSLSRRRPLRRRADEPGAVAGGHGRRRRRPGSVGGTV